MRKTSKDIVREWLWAADPERWLREALRLDPDPWQVRLMTSPHRTIMGLCGRQVGKSTSASWRALHRALYWPDSLVLLVAPSLRQSGELAGKVRNLIDRLPEKHRPGLLEDNKLSVKLDNRSRVVSLPGDGDTIRGYSAPDLVVIDEAHYCPDSLFTAVMPMLSASKGTMVQISTANGREGVYFEMWASAEDIDRITIKSEDCERIDRIHLAMMRKIMSDADYRREYECEFARKPGRLFSDEDFLRALDISVAPVHIDDDAYAIVV